MNSVSVLHSMTFKFEREVERFNRTIGEATQCYHTEGKGWKNHIQEFLLQYRTTTHAITGVALADILFQYKIPNGIPTSAKVKPTEQDKATNSRDALVKVNIKEKTDISRNKRIRWRLCIRQE